MIKHLRKKNEFRQNDFFTQQLICNGINKKRYRNQICRVYDSDEKVKYRLWFVNQKKCQLYDSQSFQVANLVMNKSFFRGVSGFDFFQGTKKFGSLLGKYKFGESFQIDFNGWTINGNSNCCDIFDKNKKHIAQIKRESHNWKARRSYKATRIQRIPHSDYVINYDDSINEVMLLLVMVMMNFSL